MPVRNFNTCEVIGHKSFDIDALYIWCRWECSTLISLLFQGVLRVRKRVTRMVLVVSVIYGVCWLPNLTTYALNYFSPSQNYGDVTYITSIVLVTCNSTVNPFIYVFVNQKFQRKVRSLLCCEKTCGNRIGVFIESTNNTYDPTDAVTQPTVVSNIRVKPRTGSLVSTADGMQEDRKT